MISRRSACAFLAAPLLPGQKSNSDLFGDAEAYERFMGRWSRKLAPLLVDFTGIPPAGRVLDVGSGTGALAFAIANQKPRCRVVGIDPAKEYVAYATSKNRFGDRVSFEVGDAQQLKFPTASFDASPSLLVYNFIPDPLKALREVCRVTKPGGPVSAAVWDYSEGMRMLRVFWDAAVRLDPTAEKLDEKNFALCRKGALAELWKKGGLSDIREKSLEIALRFASFADYWNTFLLGQGPAGAYVHGLKRDQAERLRQELAHSLKEGPFTLRARAWAVCGTT